MSFDSPFIISKAPKIVLLWFVFFILTNNEMFHQCRKIYSLTSNINKFSPTISSLTLWHNSDFMKSNTLLRIMFLIKKFHCLFLDAFLNKIKAMLSHFFIYLHKFQWQIFLWNNSNLLWFNRFIWILNNIL